MYRHLLVPRDFSPTSEHALIRAIDLAERAGADLHLLHAEVLHADPVAESRAEASATPVEAIRRRLSERPDGTEVETAGDVHVATARDVAAGPAIVRYADEHEIDLVVMGTHGRRGLRRLLLGSVTEEVMRTSGCDVLAIREDGPPIARRPVVVGVDFSKSSRRAIRRGKELASLFESELILVHVIAIVPYPSFFGTDAFTADDVSPEAMASAEAKLDTFARDAGGPAGVPTRMQILIGEPFKRISDLAAEVGAGLVVVGRRGLSGLAAVLVGSTTERTLRLAPCAVLVTKLPSGEEPGPVESENLS